MSFSDDPIKDESNKSSKKVETFFSSIAGDYYNRKYKSGHRTYMAVRQQTLLDLIDNVKFPGIPKVLDAGCGPGNILPDLIKRDFNVFAIDISAKMLQIARGNVGQNNIKSVCPFALGSIEHLPYKNETFDLVVSSGVIEYMKKDTLTLDEFYRILKPSGILCTSVTNVLSYVNFADLIIEPVKRFYPTRILLDFLRRDVLKQGSVQPRFFKVRKHFPPFFDSHITSSGFLIEERRYFHFLPVPRPLNQVFRPWVDKIGEKMESLGNTKLGFIGEGYMVLCKKNSPK